MELYLTVKLREYIHTYKYTQIMQKHNGVWNGSMRTNAEFELPAFESLFIADRGENVTYFFLPRKTTLQNDELLIID